MTRLLGHRAADILCALVAALVICRYWMPTGLPTLIAAAVLIVLVVAAYLLMRRHDRRLCEHCVRALPLMAAEQAHRKRLRFHTAHALSNRWGLGYPLVIVGVGFIPGLAGSILSTITQLGLVYLIRCAVTHSRLQPWCPRCRNGGTDQKTESPRPHLVA